MNKTIIFLDFDGAINFNSGILSFNKDCLNNILELCYYLNAKIVISSN
jgi:hypothetical protein